MSEYMEKHSVSKLLGAPPGYVGYEEGGQLTQAVRRMPYSVVLFDEIEKAHREVMHLLLQILEDGHLTDSQGRTVNFRNTIIIMTSNLGSDLIMAASEDETLKADMETRVMEVVREHLAPEFLNRIDAVVRFNTLGAEALEQIARLEMKKVLDRLEGKPLTVSVDDEVYSWICNHRGDPTYGARPLKRMIQKYILDPLALQLLEMDQEKSARINVCLEDGQPGFRVLSS